MEHKDKVTKFFNLNDNHNVNLEYITIITKTKL